MIRSCLPQVEEYPRKLESVKEQVCLKRIVRLAKAKVMPILVVRQSK